MDYGRWGWTMGAAASHPHHASYFTCHFPLPGVLPLPPARREAFNHQGLPPPPPQPLSGLHRVPLPSVSGAPGQADAPPPVSKGFRRAFLLEARTGEIGRARRRTSAAGNPSNDQPGFGS
eukprot:scaffold11478_cov103-Isochrysis_galbana.AAC.2